MHRSKPLVHSITASATASSLSGTVRPSALVVFKLIINSYLVGACTGRSAGFKEFGRYAESAGDGTRLMAPWPSAIKRQCLAVVGSVHAGWPWASATSAHADSII